MVCCAHGFSAVTGWDPVTGLGSPDFGKLRDALVALGELNAPTLSPTIEAGQPTPEPTVSPPIYPTSNPSDSPTIGAGYVIVAAVLSWMLDSDPPSLPLFVRFLLFQVDVPQ